MSSPTASPSVAAAGSASGGGAAASARFDCDGDHGSISPDDGAAKRFKDLFTDELEALPGLTIVICGKVRDGDRRIVRVQDGDPRDQNVVIVDDLVQTGGTLYECGVALRALGARSVSAFVAHGVFPRQVGPVPRMIPRDSLTRLERVRV